MGQPTTLIAVTGATGFIGNALCVRLLESGKRVRALVRNPDRARALQRLGVDLVQGDLGHEPALHELIRGADALVHCAGTVRGNSRHAFDETNVEGVRALLRVLLAASSPPRLLMLSSLAAREPHLSWYAHSKYEAEQLLKTRGHGLPWVVLRPPAVYGPGDREMLPVFRAMSFGVAPVPGPASARIALLHVQDLVEAILACLDNRAMPAAVYTLCDGRAGGYDWRELAAIAGCVWQRRVRLVRIPSVLLDMIAGVNLLLSRLMGYAPMLTPPKLRELRHPDWTASNDDIREQTGWQPQIDLQQGLQALKESEI